ncbi:MAG: flavodoxin family protein [Acidobacteria bacterium]|nr:flavodoxin family protein [Acidobacteriota bacterium]
MADKKKKVLILLGSPRKNGNSAALAERIGSAAEAAGAHVESLYIQGMDIKPCKACWGCQKPDSHGCVIEDEMQLVYPKLIEADAVVVATPVHCFNMSTQTKLWMDRCFALMGYKGKRHKQRVGIAIAYGDTDPFTSGAVNVLRCFQDSYRYAGIDITGVVYGSALNPGDIKSNKQVMAAAEELGRKLVA